MNRNKLRNALRTVHLWMGLGSGIIIFLICLSGTIYTFRTEIERWMESDRFYAKNINGKQQLPADSLISKLETLYNGKVTSVNVPGNKAMNWQISIKNNNNERASGKSSSKNNTERAARPKTYLINPYTGEVAGDQVSSTSEFFTAVMKMHRWLMLEESTGRIIVGIATVIMFFMVLTGLILWFPARIRNLKQGLQIKISANWKRINHDLHSVLGFYAFSILLIMTLTGLCWSFEWYRNGLSNALGAKVFKGRTEKPLLSGEKAGQQTGVAMLLNAADLLFPYTGNSRLSIPEDPAGAIVVTKSASGFFSVAGVDKVQFDRFTGKPVQIERFSEKLLNMQIADSIRLIHTGEIFGTFSKIIYFLACLIATSLPVTGTMIWLNKMKKNNKPVKMKKQNAEEFA